LCTWEHNIGMDCREMEWEVVDWMNQVQGRDEWWAFVNTVMSHQVPQNAGNF
jgi:hypothetical protein